jgi:predicted MFS family arabinose efflux permease
MTGLMSPVLQDDLRVSRAAVGLLVGLFFGATGLGSRTGGALVDRLGARATVTADLVVVAACAGTAALLGHYGVLLVASVIAGFGYALCITGTNVAVAAAVPVTRRARALTVKTAGIPAQVAIGSLLGPSLGERFGWRAVMGGVAVVAAAVALLASATLPRGGTVERAADRGPLPSGFVRFPIACFLLIAGTQPLFSWVVPYLRDAAGLSLTAAGRLAAVGSALGVVVMIAVASRSDRLGPGNRVPTIVVLCGACAVGGVLLAAGTRAGVIVGAIGFVGGAVSQLAAIGLLHASIVDVAPDAVGRGSGVAMTGYYLGALVAPWLFGFLVDRSGGFVTPWLVCAGSCVAAATVVSGCRRIRPAVA